MNEQATQADDRQQKITDLEDKLISSTSTAQALFDLIAAVGNDKIEYTLLDHTLCSVGTAGIEAINDITNVFTELQDLYRKGAA